MKHKVLKGFTMVELLVAMAIIGLLIATAIWGISIAQQGARNTQRREAGAQILAGFSEFYSRFNVQPTGVTWVAASSVIRLTGPLATQVYDIPVQGPAVPAAANWLVWNATVANPLTGVTVPSATWFNQTTNTFYVVGNTTSGYRVCVGLEGATASWANLSEKTNLVGCP